MRSVHLASWTDACSISLDGVIGQRANVLRPEGLEFGRSITNEVVANILLADRSIRVWIGGEFPR